MRETKLASSGAGLPRISWWRSDSSSMRSSSSASRSAGVTGERNGIEAGLERLVLQQPRAERVEGGDVELLVGRLDQRLEPLAHLGGGGRREGEREDLAGGRALLDEPGEAAGERAGLAGARPRRRRAAGRRGG